MSNTKRLSVGSISLIVMSVLVIFPVFKTFLGIFWLNGPTLSHILSVFGDISWTLALARNSFCLAGVTVTACMAPAIPLGFLLFRARIPGRLYVIILLILAASVPMFVVSAAWTAIIGNDYWFSMQTWYEKVAVGGAVQAIAWFPLATLLCGAIFSSNDPVQEEAALLDAGLPGMFFRVSLPAAARGLFATSLLIVLFSLCDITVTDCIRLNTFQQECYTQFQLPDVSIVDTDFEVIQPRRASAVALPYVILLSIAFAVVLPKLRLDRARSVHGEEKERRPHALGTVYTYLAAAVVWTLPLALAGIPLFRLLVTVGAWSNITSSITASGGELMLTVASSLVSAALSVIIATLWSFDAYEHKLARRVYGLFCIVLLTLPAPLVGISIIDSLNNDFLGWFYSSPAVYTYAYVLRFLPFAYLIIYPEVRRMAPELKEESQIAGAGTWYFVTRLLPAIAWRGVASAFLLTVILGLGEIGASFLVQSPGYTTLSVRFFTMIHSGMDAGVAALCLGMIATTVLPAGLFTALIWHRLSR